jgi:ABC-2 type transport system permease protein
MNRILVLLRRELWEHRSLWLAPVIAAAVMVALATTGLVFGSINNLGDVHFNIDETDIPLRGMPLVVIPFLGTVAQILFVAGIATLVYLLDCLYAERKDRSVLFWKSLPVSDAETVLVKFGLAAVLVPLGVSLLGMVAFTLVYGVGVIAAPQVVALLGDTDMLDLLTVFARMVPLLLVSILWYAPLTAWLMLASVSAKRSPWLIAALVPLALMLAEATLTQTHYVPDFLGDRLRPAAGLATLQRPALWLGLVAAAAMLYAVIRLRRYRDDT